MIKIKLEHCRLFKPSYEFGYDEYVLSNRLPVIIYQYLSSTKRKHYWFKRVFQNDTDYFYYQCTIKRHKNKIVYTQKMTLCIDTDGKLIYKKKNKVNLTRVTIYKTNKKYLRNFLTLYKLNQESAKALINMSSICIATNNTDNT